MYVSFYFHIVLVGIIAVILDCLNIVYHLNIMITISPYSKIVFCVASSRFFQRQIECIHHFFLMLSAPFLFFVFFPFLCWFYSRWACQQVSLCFWLPSECFAKDVADSVVHFFCPTWNLEFTRIYYYLLRFSIIIILQVEWGNWQLSSEPRRCQAVHLCFFPLFYIVH